MDGDDTHTTRGISGRLWICAVLTSLLLCHCSYLERAARNATRGAVSGVVEPASADSLRMLADSVARAFSGGAVEGFTGPSSEAALKALADSIAAAFTRGAVEGAAGASSEAALTALADSIAAAFTRGAVEGFTGPSSEAALTALADSLARAFGEGAVLGVAGGRARDSLQVTVDSLGAALTRQVIALRDSLFPVGTRRSIDTIAANLAQLTRPGEARETLSFIKESAEEILITAIVGLLVLALVIWFLLRSRRTALEGSRQNRRVLDLVTEEIDNMGQAEKERLTERIKDRALETGLEPYLHETLENRRGRQAGGSGP